jgi:hypothetical protein
MNIKILTATLGIALSTIAINTKAQTAYTQGVITYSATVYGNKSTSTESFSADSSVYAFSAGPASIKLLSNAAHSYFAVLVDVPVASKYYAAVASPAEVEEGASQIPNFTFAPGTETKQISGFNCKKVIATDAATKKTYEIWVTNDFTYPSTAVPVYYAKAGGFPVQFILLMQGQEIPVTVTSIVQKDLPKGTFGIPAEAEKITLDELKAMRGGGH